MTSAFVTGGSGFIGGVLIKRLQAEGWDVRALARSEAAAGRLRDLGAEPVTGELGDGRSLRAGTEGCEIAFHAAAKVEDLFRSIVVVRGGSPMPPRDLIPLRMPASPGVA